MKIVEDYNFLRRFLKEEIWRSNRRSFLYTVIKTILLSVRRTAISKLSTRAGALTINTVFSIVPVLALMFAIARGFGLSTLLENQIKETVQAQNDTLTYLFTFANSYLENAKGGVFIVVGVLVLLWTVIMLMTNIERAFNDIWQVKKQRTPLRMVTDYLFMFILVPLLFMVSGATALFISSSLESIKEWEFVAPILRFFIKLSPFVFSCIALSILYLLMPNTKVKVKYALLSGLVAGVAIQAFQYLYIWSQSGISTYNIIYGNFAAIPLFLLWLQVSWSICLFGVTLNYSSQSLVYYHYADDSNKISRKDHDFILLTIMSLIANRFIDGGHPHSISSLSNEYNLPTILVSKITDRLLEIGLIHEVSEDRKSSDMLLLPSIDVSTLTASEVMRRIENLGSAAFHFDKQFTVEWSRVECINYLNHNNYDKLLIKDIISK